MIIYWEKDAQIIKSQVDLKIQYAQTIKDRASREGREYLIIGSGFDIETSRIETEKYVAAYCYHWQFSLDEVVIGGRSLDSFAAFMQYLSSQLKRTHKYLLCLDANLGYEWQFCKRVWNMFGLSNLFAKERRNPLRFDVAGCIEMREVIGLFGGSLEQIANDYTVTKKMVGDLDYSKIRLSGTPLNMKEKMYCENDVLILSELGRYIFKNFFGRNPSMPMTKTGIIRAKVKRRIPNLKEEKERIQGNLPNEQLYFFFRKYLFKGGICGTNSLYMDRVLENVVCADYTSDYPACMNHYQFPDGALTEIPQTEFMSDRRIPYIANIKFVNLHSKTSHSFLSIHKAIDYDRHNKKGYIIDNGRIHSADSVTFCINDVEFRAICEAYDFDIERTEILRAWRFERYTKLPPHLLDVLNDEYLYKQKLKSIGKDDTIEYKDSKAVVNGTFGMCCTSLFMEDLEIRDCEIKPKDEPKTYEEAIKSVFLNPFWGFWITSYARALLMNVITKFPKCIIQYDTDSVYYIKGVEGSSQLENFIEEYNEEIFKMNDVIFHSNPHYRDLGAWDTKKPFKRFKGLGSKRYMYEKQDGTIETVVAGCRKGTIELQWKFESSEGYDGDIFQFFQSDMKVDKERSNKLASTYIDDYDGSKSIQVNLNDYLGNAETIELGCCTVLSPIEFNMKVTPEHVHFYKTLQSLFRNTPDSHPSKELLRRALYGED